MKLRNIIWCIMFPFLTSCYDDLGNYDYSEINEIEVDSIRELYARDVDDSLCIYPIIKGSQYSDTSRFTYEWEIGDKVLSTQHDLKIIIDMLPGTKISRFIVKDKETKVKKYYQFAINVSSSTAGDLIMVLSKYQGKAEMSYLRLDKPSNWAINYYENRFERTLGVNPKQLSIIYAEAARCYPFTNSFGRIMAIVDDRACLIDKRTLMPDTITPYLTGEAYTGNASYPKPDIVGYKTEFIQEVVGIWRKSAYGNYYQLANEFVEISGGCMYTIANLAPNVWTPRYSYKIKSPYNGVLSDFCFFDDMTPTPNDKLIQLGYQTGDIMVFDKGSGQFAAGSAYGSIKSIDKKYIKDFPGYNLLWGSATNLTSNTCISVLNNGDNCKLVLTNTGKDDAGRNDVKKLVAEINAGNVITAKTKFYMMKGTSHLFFVTGDKLYKYNLLDIKDSKTPDDRHIIAKLSDFGYDAEAVITDICVSRSERTLLLGVSRYGSDEEAKGEEAKGDLLYFDLNSSTLEINHVKDKSYKGISGIPVDVQIKYQTHWRDGYYIDETMRDNI